MKRIFLSVAFVLSAAVAHGQGFSSGSTGADGALDLSSGSQTLQLPASGVFNFTTINIPEGAVLRFTRNALNTPVVMLAQGDVVIAGTVDVSSHDANGVPPSRDPGPGGFFGGFPGGEGFGPGGGRRDPNFHYSADPGTNGRWVGPLSLVPITGGSGGFGIAHTTFASPFSTNGGGGGGAIVIASSTSIALTGAVAARGSAPCLGGCFNMFGSGSGGAIRLVANTLVISGVLDATGGFGAQITNISANPGVIRLEAAVGSLQFTGNSNPAPVLSDINPAILPPAGTPTLTITSVGGLGVPPTAGSRPDVVDVLLPTQLPDPIPMIVQASNIPVGSPVTVSINGSPGTSTPGLLAGTLASSVATVNISGLDRTKMIFLFVSTTFEVPSIAAGDNPAGPDRVAKLRLESSLGGESTLAFLRSDGSVIDRSRVPPRVRALFEK